MSATVYVMPGQCRIGLAVKLTQNGYDLQARADGWVTAHMPAEDERVTNVRRENLARTENWTPDGAA